MLPLIKKILKTLRAVFSAPKRTVNGKHMRDAVVDWKEREVCRAKVSKQRRNSPVRSGNYISKYFRFYLAFRRLLGAAHVSCRHISYHGLIGPAFRIGGAQRLKSLARKVRVPAKPSGYL